MGQKMLRFQKLTWANLKIDKLPFTLATSNFEELIKINLTQNQVDLKGKACFWMDLSKKNNKM